MPFDIKAARTAGYSDAEIIDRLAVRNKFDLAGAREAGYSDAELLDRLTKMPGAVTEKPGAVAQVARQVGLTGRYAVEGGAAGAGMVTDPIIGAIGGAVRAVTGNDYNPATLASIGVDAANAMGLPQPETTTERMVGAAARGGFSMAAPGAAAQQLAQTATGTTQKVAQTMAANQGLVTASGAGGGVGAAAGQELAAEAGGGAGAQFGAALVGGLVGGMAAPLGAAAAAPQAAKAANAVTAGVERIRTAVPAIADRVERTLRRNPDPVTPTPGTRASGGSAGTDIADMRRTNADTLPVPIKLTQGQATRTFEQQRFEREMAKDPTNGEPLRNRYAQQNEDIMKNFDAWVDQTGAEAPNLRAVGTAVDQALVKKAARDKAEIRVAYKEAEKAGELAAPIEMGPVVEYLNASAPDAATAPILNAIRQHVIKLGVAEENGGQLTIPQGKAPMFSSLMNTPTERPSVSLKTAETLRQAINRATDYEPTNIRQATIVKGLIDAQTEGAGGAAYRSARRMRENYAKQYEDRAVVSSLLNNKRGTADRKVALEDVWDHAILKGSLDDVRSVRKVLQTGGPDGQQAWRELQGQTMNWLKNEATKNVATDTRGNPIVSADKLNKAIRSIDADGKMDFIFGKKGAEQLRDLNDLVKLVHTAPPGSVNTSNTASVLLAALTEAGVTGSMTGIPVPVLSALRVIAMKVKDRRIQKRIEQALNGRSAPPPPPARPPGSTLH